MKFCWVAAVAVLVGCAPERQLSRSTEGGPAGWRRTGVVEFCEAKRGRKVGDGGCWALADEALKSAGMLRPGGDLRVWGRVVDPARELVQAGDVLEFESARFRDEKMTVVTGMNHTAVAVTGERDGKFIVAEQNSGGRKFVTFREMSLKTLVSGKVLVYRPG